VHNAANNSQPIPSPPCSEPRSVTFLGWACNLAAAI
jgi:hypothetical protein